MGWSAYFLSEPVVLGNEGDRALVEQQNIVDDGDGGAMDLGAGEESPTESFLLLEEEQSLVLEEFEVERIAGTCVTQTDFGWIRNT